MKLERRHLTIVAVVAALLALVALVLRPEVIPVETQVDIAALSGPTFAREVSRQIPSAVVAAAATTAVAEEVQTLFSTPVFRVYTNTDVLGVELGGALKMSWRLPQAYATGCNSVIMPAQR